MASSRGNSTATVMKLKKSWQVAIENALTNSSLRPMWASDTIVLVTVVPMLAPMIIGTALAMGSGLSGAATNPTMSDVVTDELCIRVVARIPTISPISGLLVLVKNASNTSDPRLLNPSPSPFIPARKM